MNMRKSILLSALVLASAGAVAVPVAYEGVLVPAVPGTGQVGGFSWFLDNGAGVDYWRFAGVAGQTVSFAVDRLNGNLDPALSFYAGITTADTSQFSASSSWGGLTFIGSLDDEKAAFVTPGPAGDPLGSFVLASTGNYTVVVGGAKQHRRRLVCLSADDDDRCGADFRAFGLGDVRARPCRSRLLAPTPEALKYRRRAAWLQVTTLFRTRVQLRDAEEVGRVDRRVTYSSRIDASIAWARARCPNGLVKRTTEAGRSMPISA